jgi:hypothetical protein
MDQPLEERIVYGWGEIGKNISGGHCILYCRYIILGSESAEFGSSHETDML